MVIEIMWKSQDFAHSGEKLRGYILKGLSIDNIVFGMRGEGENRNFYLRIDEVPNLYDPVVKSDSTPRLNYGQVMVEIRKRLHELGFQTNGYIDGYDPYTMLADLQRQLANK